ncbi:LysR family transcriptional regulator [Xanthobacter agilis]|uniref:LysR family transcriptional regulator n=1 Tax=Xanthobacter agilis TaxID=47492 RepID=UPI00372AC0A3
MRRSRRPLDVRGVRSGRISLSSLIQLVAVAEHLNFRHAANALGVTQSSVSTRIKALEETLGVILFERRHRGVRLTEAGQCFVAEVATGIDHIDLAVQTAGAISNGTEGRLTIGLHSSIAGGFLADLWRQYRSIYPKIEQRVVEGRSSDTIAMVRDGKLDVAFVLGGVDPRDCHARRLWEEPFMIALPLDHSLAAGQAVSWVDIAAETFLLRHDGAGPQLQDHVVCRVSQSGHAARIRRCDVGRDTLMHMVAIGEGVTLTTAAASHLPFPGVVFRTLADEPEPARFSAVWSPHNRSSALKNLLALADAISRSACPPENRTS